MSEVNNQGPDLSKPHNFFAFVIDGEVVWMHMLPEEVEHMTAVYSSDPKIVIVPKELGGIVRMGWKFDGDMFSPAE
jgi:hypothetical protein